MKGEYRPPLFNPYFYVRPLDRFCFSSMCRRCVVRAVSNGTGIDKILRPNWQGLWNFGIAETASFRPKHFLNIFRRVLCWPVYGGTGFAVLLFGFSISILGKTKLAKIGNKSVLLIYLHCIVSTAACIVYCDTSLYITDNKYAFPLVPFSFFLRECY